MYRLNNSYKRQREVLAETMWHNLEKTSIIRMCRYITHAGAYTYNVRDRGFRRRNVNSVFHAEQILMNGCFSVPGEEINLLAAFSSSSFAPFKRSDGSGFLA